MKITRRIFIPLVVPALLPSTEEVKNCTKPPHTSPWTSRTNGIRDRAVTGGSSVSSSMIPLLDGGADPVVLVVTTTVKGTMSRFITITAARCSHTTSITTMLTESTATASPIRPLGLESGQIKGCNPPEVEALLSDQARNSETAWVTAIVASTCMIRKAVSEKREDRI